MLLLFNIVYLGVTDTTNNYL